MGIEKEFLTWSEYGKMMIELANQCEPLIKERNINYLIGVPRGGLTIAVYFSHRFHLDIIDFDDFRYDARIDRSDILILDDLVDTGKTLRGLRPLKRKNDFMSAVIYKKPWANFNPDVFIATTENWIVFPYEDINEIPNR